MCILSFLDCFHVSVQMKLFFAYFHVYFISLCFVIFFHSIFVFFAKAFAFLQSRNRVDDFFIYLFLSSYLEVKNNLVLPFLNFSLCVFSLIIFDLFFFLFINEFGGHHPLAFRGLKFSEPPSLWAVTFSGHHSQFLWSHADMMQYFCIWVDKAVPMKEPPSV